MATRSSSAVRAMWVLLRGIIGRHTALVAEEHVHARPVDPRHRCEPLIDRAWRGAARQHDVETPVRGDGLGGLGDDILGRAGDEGCFVLMNRDVEHDATVACHCDPMHW